ncbi:Longin-like domain-containing protein [Cladochytrium replicatum]|nr:Longin-like domain-containing protein [Cladochytrium replicatum]
MVKSQMNLTLSVVKAVIVLDSEGKRILSKYYTSDYPSLKEQKPFEKSLFDKTKRMNSEIIMFDGQVVVYKNSVDLFIYFLGSADENELILASITQSFQEALSILLKGQVEKRVVMDNLDLVILALDEAIDDGVILESEPQQIALRVTKKSSEDTIPISDQTFAQAFASAKEQLTRQLLK